MDLSSTTLKGPDWAHGCESCKYGIVLAPEMTSATEVYLERIVQMIDGDITFCTCQAGQRYHVSLLNRRQELIENARKDPRMAESARAGTHPDIARARAAIRAAQAKRVPTVHLAGERVQP